MWILLDNYDSFTHILLHYLQQAGGDCLVIRNDEKTLQQIIALQPSRVIISPGPGTPLQSGITLEVIAHFYDKIPILGICLGHQALGMHFGAKLVHAPQPRHGKTSVVSHSNHWLFNNVPPTFEVMRYHSLCIEKLENTGLISIATSEDDGCIMAIAHETFPCIGIQFHPESVLTTEGAGILKNWANSDYKTSY